MKKAGQARFVKILSIVYFTILFTHFNSSAQTLLDDFNRPSNLIVGSGANNQNWLETETAGSNDYRARLENNMLVLSSRNNLATGSSGMEQVVFEAKTQYATTFNAATAELTWAFNFRQSRIDPSGFGATTFGLAYVLGSSKVNFKDPEAVGYAVIIGNSGTPDPIKLVRFKNGLTANSNLTTLITSSEIAETAYYSIKVTFEPCSKTWSLQVRNDNGTFADPLTQNNPALTFSDQTYSNFSLPFSGAAFNHGSVNETAYFDNIYLPNAVAQANQIYTWNGLTSSDFNEPTNWNPVRTCLRASDILEFGQGGTVSLSNASSQEIGQLAILNNTTLVLKAKTGATQTLQIAGGTNEDLTIAAGSSLIIDSNDALEISFKTGATGQVFGTITFQNSAMNLGRAHRLLAADANAISFENGSQFIVNRLSGEPFGNSGTASVVRFKAGSTYIAKDGASPFGLTSPNSKVVFETGSLYKHEQTGTAPKFDGRIYADFELNVTGNVAINFGTSATTTTKIDNFLIRSGNLNITLASNTTPLPFHIKGNLTVISGAALNFLPAALANTSLITFNGTSRQQISGNVNFGQFANIEVNNPFGIDLQTPLSIKGNFQFTNGILTMQNGVVLHFEDNATASGMSNSSFVEGKVLKSGDNAFSFPVGKSSFYAPILISAPLNVTDQYAAEYFLSDPSKLFGAAAADSLVQISGSEYWDLTRTAGTSEVKVTLSYDVNRSGFNANPQELRVAHFKAATVWVNEGRAVLEATPSYSLISTKNVQSSFSPFTFGIVAPNNPLPVELINFTAKRTINTVELTWQTASELNCDRFEIEKSLDGIQFEKLGEVKGQGNSSVLKRYGFTAKNSWKGLEFYRLKQIDSDGTVNYSKIISLKSEGTDLISIYPNPAKDFIALTCPEVKIRKVEVLNILGQVIKRVETTQLQNTLNLDIANLPAGNYFVKINDEAKSFRIIKTAQ